VVNRDDVQGYAAKTVFEVNVKDFLIEMLALIFVVVE
jgi:hypothetical protein